MWQLDRNGDLKQVLRRVEGEILIDFPAHSDGRGFSQAKKLKLSGSRQTLVATGKLIPDQARMAFQCGFDLIEIDEAELKRHGETAWRAALASAVDATYVEGGVLVRETQTSGKGIWSERYK